MDFREKGNKKIDQTTLSNTFKFIGSKVARRWIPYYGAKYGIYKLCDGPKVYRFIRREVKVTENLTVKKGLQGLFRFPDWLYQTTWYSKDLSTKYSL